MKIERLHWIDCIKGLLLFLICLGHFSQVPEAISWVIKPTASYYVPIFFILSGILVSANRTYRDYCKRKVHSLLIPYIVFGIIFIVFDWNTYLEFPDSLSHNICRLFFDGRGVEKAAPLWFLLCLFGANIISYAIINAYKKLWILPPLMVLCSLMSYVLSIYNIQLPLMLHIWPSAVLYILSGYVINITIPRLNGNSIVILMTFLIATCIGIIGLIIPLGDMHHNFIASYPLFHLCPVALSISIVILCNRISISYIPLEKFAQNGVIVLASHCWLVILYSTISSRIFTTYPLLFFIGEVLFVFATLMFFIIPPINKYVPQIAGNPYRSSLK